MKEERSINGTYNRGFQEGRQSKLKEELGFLKNLLKEYMKGDFNFEVKDKIKMRIKQISKELAGIEE